MKNNSKPIILIVVFISIIVLFGIKNTQTTKSVDIKGNESVNLRMQYEDVCQIYSKK